MSARVALRDTERRIRRFRRQLKTVLIRQAARKAFDLPRLGTGPLERITVSLILAGVFGFVALGLSHLVPMTTGGRLALAGAGFLTVLCTSAVLVLWTADDERLSRRAISRRHCLLTVLPDRADVRDLGSRNHTLVNSWAVAADHPLRDGDRLYLCGTELRVRFLPDEVAPESSWVAVPADGPGVSLDQSGESPRHPDLAAAGDDRHAVTVEPDHGEVSPGLYDLPLNIPDRDLSLHIDLRATVGRGRFGQVWWARTRGSGPVWHDGTFILVFAGTAAVVVNGLYGSVTHVGVSLVFGLVDLALIYAIGDVSGAHLNPAVTTAFWLAGRFPPARVLPYAAAQCAGAVAASAVVRFLFPAHKTLGATLPVGGPGQAFVLESLLTLVLMFVILCVSTGAKEKGITAGIAVGAVIGLEALLGGPVSGASMNPARSLGPAVVSGHLEHLWVYLVAPVAGAAAGVPLCQCVHGGSCCARPAEAFA